MRDFDAEIAEKRTEIERLRTQELPPLADALCQVAAPWASTRWEEIIRRAIDDRPELAKRNQNRLSKLKADLGELRRTAEADAHGHLRPWLLHESAGDDKLSSYVSESYRGEPHVSLPRLQSSDRDERFRRLVGSIGPALEEAGLLGPDSEVTAQGRFRYHLEIPGEVQRALTAYEGGLADLARSCFEVQKLVREKDQAEATALWDDA